MPLQTVFSNQPEALFERLLAALQAAPAGPFERDTVIVPSAAVQRWLQQRLADRWGIAANLDMPFLAPWLHAQLRQETDPEPLGATAWPWRVYELLGDARWLRAHPRLARSLGEPEAPGAEALRWERASGIALQLERLGLERPDWLAAWRAQRLIGNHPDEAWQAALWRAVGDEAGDLLARALPRLAGARAERPVHLFAPARLAPLHLQALQLWGGDLRLYQLNPCRAYWFDLVSPRRLARLQAAGRADAHEVGHSLLASNAQAWQQQLTQLAEAGHLADEGDYREPAGDSLLARLQRSLLNLEDLEPGPADRSLELHVCHSLTRELEVLHDRLLGLVAADPTLQLSDILVLCPDLDAAAPRIEAVFGSAPPARFLPYAISGRSAPPLAPPLRRFLALLALLDGPAPAPELAALLPEASLDALQAAGLRAGLDAAHAQRQGLSAAHTLDAALQRLLLAHCLPQHTAFPPLGPWQAAPQALPAALLASLQGLASSLAEAAARAAAPLPPEAWTALLLQWAEAWLPEAAERDSETAEAGRLLREAIARLGEAWQQAGLRSALPLARVRAALLEALHDPVRGGVPGGAISFSSLASLRGIPARVIALIGLDDGAWPRAAAPEPCDLLAAQPRAGDRQPRAEQRQLFLEALLSAREVLHLSHAGRSPLDDSPRPPSVLVAELMDFLGEAAVRVEQPLQPFSPRAFDPADPLRQSFRAELLPPAPAAPALHLEGEDDEDEAQDSETQPPFLAQPLPTQPAPAETSLAALQAALRHPGRAWLQARLDLRLPWDEPPWDAAEPFALERRALSDWVERLLPRLGAEPTEEQLLAWAAADPQWPAGALAGPALRAELPRLRAYAAARAAWQAAPRHEALPPLQLPGLRLQLQGLDLRWLDGRPQAQIAAYRRSGAADQLAAWAAHLALQAALGAQAGCRLLHAEGCLRFRAVAEPQALLTELAQLVLADAGAPPLLPPRTALALVEENESKAASAWRNERFGGESADAHWALLRRGQSDDALAAIAPLAEAVFGPLLEHRE